MYLIGLKYCGGCTPEYDRTALANDLKERLTGLAQLVPWHSPGTDLILIIAGCTTACVDKGPFDGKQVITLTSPKDGPALINLIKKGAFK